MLAGRETGGQPFCTWCLRLPSRTNPFSWLGVVTCLVVLPYLAASKWSNATLHGDVMLMTFHAQLEICMLVACFAQVLCFAGALWTPSSRKNKELGERLGCWKGSYLVEDDGGSVRKALQELQQPTAEQNADQL